MPAGDGEPIRTCTRNEGCQVVDQTPERIEVARSRPGVPGMKPASLSPYAATGPTGGRRSRSARSCSCRRCWRGPRRGAQGAARGSRGTAASTILLTLGHLLSTTTFDALADGHGGARGADPARRRSPAVAGGGSPRASASSTGTWWRCSPPDSAPGSSSAAAAPGPQTRTGTARISPDVSAQESPAGASRPPPGAVVTPAGRASRSCTWRRRSGGRRRRTS